VTTNKTDFFREPEHFDLPGKEHRAVAPRAARRAVQKAKLKLWSAASSNGAEAFTIAMVMADLAARTHAFDFAVLGTDISTEVLAAGASGRSIPREMVTPVPPTCSTLSHAIGRAAPIRASCAWCRNCGGGCISSGST
jgi:chemotaxis protein methyltransferase CheR